MKAAIFEKPGLENLEVKENVVEPKITDHDVLIKVKMCGINPIDYTELLGISVDGVWSHLAFSKDRNIHFPLLSDFEPKGAVAKRYGVYRQQDGTTERALFVLDSNGIIRWSYISPIGVNPGAEGILKALESLSESK